MDRALVGRLGTFGAAVVVGAAASAIAPSLPIVIAGTALSGVAGGIFANDLGAMDAQLGDPDLRNAHLTRAVGRAIAVVINEVAQDHQGRSRLALDALAQSARQDWPHIIKDILGHQTPTELFEENLAETYFATAAKDFETLRALANWQDWRPVIHALRPRARRGLRQSWRARLGRWRSGGLYPLGTLTPTLVDTLAQELHKQFPKAIREVLKRDFAQGEEAFAGMVFDLLGNLTAGQQQLAQQLTELRQQTASLSQILADQLTRDLQRLEGIVIEESETIRKTVEDEHEKTRAEIIREIRQPQPPSRQNPNPPSNLARYRRTVPKFVGREVALAELSALFADVDQVAIAAALSGMGGLGKTELAWQWAQQEYEAGTFPGGVVWLDMVAGNPAEQLLLFYQTEFQQPVPEELPTLAQRLAYCWQHWPQQGAVLLVLDDVVRERDGATLSLFRPGGQFRVLWTTRERWTGVQDYRLDTLSDEAARQLLSSYLDGTRLEAEPEALGELLRWFDGLPLGLELAARYLALDEFLSIADYLQGLHLTHDSLDVTVEMAYPYGLEAALAFSWARLEDEAARRLALRLGLYGAAAIPLTAEEQQDWREPLRKLVNLNLLEREAADSLRLHPLVRQFLRQRLAVALSTEARAELRREVAGVIVKQGQRIPDSFTMAQAREFAPWIPHLQEVAEELLPWVGDEDVITPCNGIARFYEGQGLYDAAQPWYEQAVVVVKERLGNRHRDTAAALNNLAGLYESQGKYGDAEPLYLEALAIDRESLPANHPDLAISLNNLAELYRVQGKYGDAEPLYLEALAIVRESLPANHPQLAIHLNNLAGLYRAQGKYGDAEPLYLEALEIDRESLPTNHPELANHLNNLAGLYESQGKYGDAEPLYLEALEIDRESLPANHPQLAIHLNNLAGLYYGQEKYAEAEPLLLETASIFYESLGEEHPNTQTVLNNVISFYRTALAAGLPDRRLRQHPLGDLIRSRL
ncbi:tetratricopeptide repeat protein [Phormidium yuhuli AB48]|uniref:Tetratricopeptide repeat protein n=1 Tax=Phormidium yuhuli AB48 TaxID=2940671 RepID=A0ABY5AMT3_9CYAN|nr:tetratricopeptide repeat protein [Phormidium yuhuli]USR89544.1 tetratricopeptide repeat protein [Phormidium yuhuli AB48]